MKLTCIAVDDEPLALEKIVDYIEQVPFLELKGKFDDGMEVLSFLQDEQVDLLFLDIQMPQLLGTQLVQVLKQKPQIIFTTAYSEYAMEGYELDITDYLLKPISFGRFLKSSQKALQRAANNKPAKKEAPAARSQQADFIFVKTEFKWQQIPLAEIQYIEGMKDYLAIHTTQERILTLMSFNDLLDKLPAKNFIRIHKSFVVAIDKIKEIEKARVIIGETPVPIGETYKTAFMNRLKSEGLM